MRTIAGILLLVIFCTEKCSLFCAAEPVVEEVQLERDGKVLPVFQVVKFPNAVCAGGSRNGTCYTAEECSTKGGTSDGSCASGFGVCCVFALACGGSASENQTYIVQTSATAVSSPCTYTICPCGSNICRIRYDFTTMVLSSAVAGTTVLAPAASTAAASLIGPILGDCVDDQFSISGGAGQGSPIICGTNTGYHMIVDTDPAGDDCHTANFNIGGSTTTSRSWEIRVTQYACGDHDNSGPPGCLQYYTATSNTIQNFAFPPTATAVTAAVTHLSSQQYDICIRRASGFCYICYGPNLLSNPVISAAATGEASAAAQKSFGLSVGTIAANPTAGVSVACSTDWIEIPGATTAAIAAIAAAANPPVLGGRICGRIFSSVLGTLGTAAGGSFTICTRNLPFRVGVNFNDAEADSVVAAAMTTLQEQNGAPGGIVGFKLTYWQVSC